MHTANEQARTADFVVRDEGTSVPFYPQTRAGQVPEPGPECVCLVGPEWSGSPDPERPDEQWICDDCGAIHRVPRLHPGLVWDE